MERKSPGRSRKFLKVNIQFSQLESFQQTTDNLNINFEPVYYKDDFISYINSKRWRDDKFYSCNAGTNDSNGESFAQAWRNKIGGISMGFKNGRFYYGFINSCPWPLPFRFIPEDNFVKNLNWFGDVWNSSL